MSFTEISTATGVPYYYVSSPPKDGRQKFRWVLEGTDYLSLADWSYGHNCFATEAEAIAQAKRAKAKYPNRIFRADKSIDGNQYERGPVF